jgi:SpoVK/Ycf46/Vps4 family AAA+-type ATPase
VLLYGPPGCGKTFLARAVAGELGARFFALGLNDVLDMWLGESERRLHDAFAAARRAAPCVLFLDELDALGQKRSHLRRSAGRNVVNQLLAELDGAQADNEGLFVLAATNHPWDVDTSSRPTSPPAGRSSSARSPNGRSSASTRPRSRARRTASPARTSCTSSRRRPRRRLPAPPRPARSIP